MKAVLLADIKQALVEAEVVAPCVRHLSMTSEQLEQHDFMKSGIIESAAVLKNATFNLHRADQVDAIRSKMTQVLANHLSRCFKAWLPSDGTCLASSSIKSSIKTIEHLVNVAEVLGPAVATDTCVSFIAQASLPDAQTKLKEALKKEPFPSKLEATEVKQMLTNIARVVSEVNTEVTQVITASSPMLRLWALSAPAVAAAFKSGGILCLGRVANWGKMAAALGLLEGSAVGSPVERLETLRGFAADGPEGGSTAQHKEIVQGAFDFTCEDPEGSVQLQDVFSFVRLGLEKAAHESPLEAGGCLF